MAALPPKKPAPLPAKASTTKTPTKAAPAKTPTKTAAQPALPKPSADATPWAKRMGITKHEAFGLAQNAHRFFTYGQQERGRRMMTGLVALVPDVASFQALLGAMCGRMGDDDEALRCYAKAIALEPGNLAARVNRAEVLLKRAHIAEALDDLVVATRIDPKQKSVLGKRAHSLARVTSAALHDLLAKRRSAPAPRAPAPRR